MEAGNQAADPYQAGDPGLPDLGDSCFASRLLSELAEKFERNVHGVMQFVWHLKERRAGLRTDGSGEDARRRLQNHRLRTTYVDERIVALREQSLGLREQVAEGLRNLLEPALKLEMAEAELAAAEETRAELDAADAVKEKTGLYPETARAIDFLFDQYGVNRHHWAAAGPWRLKQVAEILRDKSGLISKDEREAEEYRRIMHL